MDPYTLFPNVWTRPSEENNIGICYAMDDDGDLDNDSVGLVNDEGNTADKLWNDLPEQYYTTQSGIIITNPISVKGLKLVKKPSQPPSIAINRRNEKIKRTLTHAINKRNI